VADTEDGLICVNHAFRDKLSPIFGVNPFSRTSG